MAKAKRKKPKTCTQKKISKVMRENKDKPKKQRIAMALSIARRHCGKK